MKRLIVLLTLISTAALAQTHRTAPNDSFASDRTTIPVVANVIGANGAQFTSYLALFNPTSSTIAVTASFFDGSGTRSDRVISLGPSQVLTYTNFLHDAFAITGGGTLRLTTGDPNSRIIVNSEVRSGGFSTTVPALEFAGSSSRSFAPGITVDSTSRTNIGCADQSGNGNTVTATIRDTLGGNLGTITLNLAPNAWGQTGVNVPVTNGYVQFDPTDNAVCYAVVVNNSTNDGRFIQAAEYRP